MIQRIAGWSDQVRAVMPDAQPLRVGEVLRWPGVMATPRWTRRPWRCRHGSSEKALDELDGSEITRGPGSGGNSD